jgi:hypothetical protein
VSSWNLLSIKSNNLDHNTSQWCLNPMACLSLPSQDLPCADLKIEASAASLGVAGWQGSLERRDGS